MKENDKYLLLKNFMHNELGITREDIREWIRDAVHSEAERLIAQEFGKFDPHKIVKDLLFEDKYWGQKQIQEDCRKLLIEALSNKIRLIVDPRG